MSSMITVSIVTYHTAQEELDKCLQSLLASSLVSCVYIIDNGNDPDLRSFCQNYGARVVYYASANDGYGAGHNRAIRMVMAGDAKEVPTYHLVVNSDVFFSAGVLEALHTYMDANPDVGQVIPKVLYPDGRVQFVCRLLPTPIDLYCRRFVSDFVAIKRKRHYTLDFTGFSTPMNAPYLSGCFMFLRVDALRHVGLFDERYFLYLEDVDLTRRIHRSYRTMFYPAVTIYHAHRAASYTSVRMLCVHIRNMCRYFNKWGWYFDRERETFNRRLLDDLRQEGLHD